MINSGYYRAIQEFQRMLLLYSDPGSYPSLLQDFIKIANEIDVDITVRYAFKEIDKYFCAGFYLITRDKKGLFLEDYMFENRVPGTPFYEEGIKWFKNSLKEHVLHS